MILSVDPGVGGTGYAVWGEKLVDFGTLHFSVGVLHWEDRVQNVAVKFSNLFRLYKISKVVMEFPNYMHGTQGRMVAESGDLIKLAVLTGMLMQCTMSEGVEFEPVYPGTWKGQLPKIVCENRIRKILGKQFPKDRISNHAIDAIGIGLWAQGKF